MKTSVKNVNKYVAQMKGFTAQASKSTKLSKQILVKAGICTKNGNLKSPYK